MGWEPRWTECAKWVALVIGNIQIGEGNSAWTTPGKIKNNNGSVTMMLSAEEARRFTARAWIAIMQKQMVTPSGMAPYMGGISSPTGARPSGGYM